MDLFNILIITAALMNLSLGILVYYKRNKNRSSIWFSLLAFTLAVWCGSILAGRITQDVVQAMIWVKLIYASGLLIPAVFFYFANIFPYTDRKPIKPIKLIAFVPIGIFLLFILFSNYIITDVIIPIRGGERIVNFGLGYPFYLLFMFGYFIAAFYLLIKSYFKSTDITRVQVRYVLLGTGLATPIALTTNLILPSLGYFTLGWTIGPLSTVLMALFITYAILKHHLLNVKVVSIEILAGLIVLISLIDMILSRSLYEFLFRLPFFILVASFAYLLIHGTFKQIAASRKIQTQAQELEKANISLKELLSMKTEFLNTVSHQLRTPTTIFRSMLSMITEKGTLTKEQKEEWINDCYGAANRLLIIIEGILEANTFEGRTPAFDFKLCDLEQIIQDVVNNIFKNIAQKKGVILEYQRPKEKLPQIMADANWLRSVFIKVIDNAIWYTRKNGRVDVSCQQIDHKVQIKVQDTGIGLTQEDKEILFKKFSRGRGSWGMNVNSSGLGLYITKKIIEGHHGEITAQSEGEDKGSIFTITLPVMQEI